MVRSGRRFGSASTLLQPWDRILAVGRGGQSWCVRALLSDVQLKHGAGISLRFSVLKHGLVLRWGQLKQRLLPIMCVCSIWCGGEHPKMSPWGSTPKIPWGRSVLSDTGSHIPGGSEHPPEPRAPWGFCSEHTELWIKAVVGESPG